MAKTKQTQSIPDIIATSWDKKPEKLLTDELFWRYGIRAVLRGDNLMLTGPTGTGKDLFITSLGSAMQREVYYIPLGATQDPRSSIIGNTHFEKSRGTFTQLSYFIQAIQKPNAIIAFDELTRAHFEVQNLLMTVLDKDKRWIRVDEDPDTPTIHVAEGVCFLATANIGAEYLATRGLDRAFLDRWSILELAYLDKNREIENLKRVYPDLDSDSISLIANIVTTTRQEIAKDVPTIDTALSTRASEEMAGLVADGFSVKEAVRIKAYPLYSTDGSPSPRQSFIQMTQRFFPDNDTNPSPINVDTSSSTMDPTW